MPIVHRSGDIFTTELPAIGHGVNTEGVMGSGIAKTVRELYPSVYRTYRHVCLSRGLVGGDHLPLMADEHDENRWILNIASQEPQGRNARYDFLEKGLEKAFTWAEDKRLEGIALPKIGAGIGGLEWTDVLAIIENRAAMHPSLTVEVWTFEPQD